MSLTSGSARVEAFRSCDEFISGPTSFENTNHADLKADKWKKNRIKGEVQDAARSSTACPIGKRKTIPLP
jgi:hypothetical protein